jgi:TRAP-type C4-dicarboxylate transport system substrate-binding protein
MKTKAFFLGVLAAALLAPAAASADPIEVKIASLAPDGSAWAKIMQEGGRKMSDRTGGRVTVKFFFSGSQGDERDVVRKMKLGQIDGAALTAVGLGLIKGDVRILELPFLFKNDRELDYVRTKMAPDFEKQFQDAGYELLSWGDVGWVHLFSNIPVNALEDLNKTKMWAWTDDPIVRTFFKHLGVNGVPLGVPDVLTALQTGTIDACYGSPLAMVALQWYTKVKFATETAISYSIGALVIRKEVFAKLSPEDQKAVRAVGVETGEELMKAVRRDNERAKKAMVKSGVQFIQTPPALVDKFETTAHEAWQELSGGKLYSTELLERVKKYVAEARSKG